MTRLPRVFTARGRAGALHLLLPAVLLAALSGPASSETSAGFQVSATLVAGCAVDGVGMEGDAGSFGVLDFGEGMALATTGHSASLAASQTLVLRCTPGTSLTMSIGPGLNAEGGLRHLRVGTGTDKLPYRLYRDAAFTQEIGIDVPQGISITGDNMNDVHLPVHGHLVLPGARSPGTYTDTLVVTLQW
jgi:spore coat protein U-like protein